MDKIIYGTYDELSAAAAAILAGRIKEKPDCVLGLATGSTPIGMYKSLVDMYISGVLDFSGVRTFNLDEYYPIKNDDKQSYGYFMREHLFSHVNIPSENIHLLHGDCVDAEAECAAYEKTIKETGGIDIQVLGIGSEGHIAFNEAGKELALRTHVEELSPSTIAANARFFSNMEEVPKRALTMGMASILDAKAILLLITGAAKASAAKQLFSGWVSPELPASFLQLHPDVTVLLDAAAASLL